LIWFLIGGLLALGIRWQLAYPWRPMPILGQMLATLHNVHFYLKLMDDIRSALAAGHFGAFKRQFLAEYLREEKKTRHVR